MGAATDPARPALATSPKIIFFTDFDGTITLQDSNDYLTDNIGFGVELRKKGNADALFGRRAFADTFREMMDSVHLPYDQCIDLLLANVRLDPVFKEFYAWAKANNVPVVVLSGGMEPIIKALLGHLVGEEEVKELQIVSNNVKVREGKTTLNEENGWEIVYHDPGSEHGHDKSIEIRKYSSLPDGERPILLYAGDGVSDLSAARETDLMFAKAGRDLVTYCEKEGIHYAPFEDFSSILATTRDIAEGKISVNDAAKNRTVAPGS